MSSSTQQSNKCFKCGGQYPHPCFCHAGSKFCNKCGKRSHFATCCKTNMGSLPMQYLFRVQQHFYQNPTFRVQPHFYQNPINQVTHSPSSSNETLSYSVHLPFVNNASDHDVQYLFTINQMSDSQREYCSKLKERKFCYYS